MYIRILLIILFSLVSQSSSVIATEDKVDLKTGDKYEISNEISIAEEKIDGNIHLVASSINIDSIIFGNVYIMGNSVDLSGIIDGNLHIVGNNINISNLQLKGSAYIKSSSIDIKNSKASNGFNVNSRIGVIDMSEFNGLTLRGGEFSVSSVVKELSADATKLSVEGAEITNLNVNKSMLVKDINTYSKNRNFLSVIFKIISVSFVLFCLSKSKTLNGILGKEKNIVELKKYGIGIILTIFLLTLFTVSILLNLYVITFLVATSLTGLIFFSAIYPLFLFSNNYTAIILGIIYVIFPTTTILFIPVALAKLLLKKTLY